MKKVYFLLGCVLAVAVLLTACGKKAPPLQLPEAKAVTSIAVTAGGTTEIHLEEEWIEQMMEDFINAEPTGRESVQDTPLAEDWLKIEIQPETGGVMTLFAYQKTGQEYLEQPYQGIYRLEKEPWQRLHPEQTEVESESNGK